MSSEEGLTMDGSSYDDDDDGSYIIEEIVDDDDDDDDQQHDDATGTNTSIMNDILQEKLERIAVLERANRLQETQLVELQTKHNEDSVKHKQEVYFLKLELDGARRDCTAAEERMAELFEDLKHVAAVQEKKLQNGDGGGENGDYNYAAEVLENQISMVQTTSGEVIRSLKEEIADLMEDRCRMEADLLNQMATLDREKRSLENNFTQRLEAKDETIERLKEQKKKNKQNNSNDHPNKITSTTYNGEMDELEEELLRVTEEKKRAEDVLAREREEADDMIHRLEDANSKLQNKLEALADDLTVLRETPDAHDTVKALDRISNEREEIVSTLERVATIWERADTSIVTLEDSMDKLRPTDNTPIKGDRERLLSTLETASLIHGQVKVALLLVEVRLRNQLQSLKNDKLSMTWAAPSDEVVVASMREILDEGLAAVSHVESTISQQVGKLEEKALEETKNMKKMIEDRSQTLEGMQVEHKTLENDIIQLKSSNQDSNGNLLANISEEELRSPEKPTVKEDTVGISGEVVEQLHLEVHRIVDRIRQKNEVIETMKQALEEQKLREEALKKDLKRAMRRQLKAEGQQSRLGASSSSVNSPARPSKGPKKFGASSRSLSSPPDPMGPREGAPSSNSVSSPNNSRRRAQKPSVATGTSSTPLSPPVRSKDEGEKVMELTTQGFPVSPKRVSQPGSSSSSDPSSKMMASPGPGMTTPPLKTKQKKADTAAMSPGLPLSPSGATTTPKGAPNNNMPKKLPKKSPKRQNVVTTATSPAAAAENNKPLNPVDQAAANKDANFASPTKSPTKKLIPLLPSPREISKPRMYSHV